MSGELVGTSYPQLDLDGDETPIAVVNRARAPLSRAQQEIVRELRTGRTITSADAGVIVHAHRPQGCRTTMRPGEACCEFASSDGGDAMKRLVDRGLAVKAAAGLWIGRKHG